MSKYEHERYSRRVLLAQGIMFASLAAATYGAAKIGMHGENPEQKDNQINPRKLSVDGMNALDIKITSDGDIPIPTEAVVKDYKPLFLHVPSINLSGLKIQDSFLIPRTSEPGDFTLTVPEQGIAAPAMEITNMRNKIWIFGHSRWKHIPQDFFALQQICVGDPVIIDAFDKNTKTLIPGLKFRTDKLILTDNPTATRLVGEQSALDIPPFPQVLLQTSVRPENADPIFDIGLIKQKSDVTFDEGDENDPSKYLLLLVIANLADEEIKRLL